MCEALLGDMKDIYGNANEGDTQEDEILFTL